MADLPNPHDALIRTLLEDAERARDFIKDHLPNNIAGLLADDPPQILDGSFVDEALAGSQSDILMQVRLKAGGEAFCYVLVEAKSTPDPGLPLQLATYMARIWKRYAGDSHRKLRNLPPIIPMVAYTGKKAWNVPAGLAEMIASPDPELAFLPGERYIVRSLRAMPVDALSRNPALRAGFIALRQEALDYLSAITQTLPEGSVLWRQILEYVVRTYDDVDIDDLKAALLREGHTELEVVMGTIAETLLEQGSERGFAKGKAEGLAAGKAELLTQLLTRRFGPLPEPVTNRITWGSLADLESWFDAAIDAPDIDSVFTARGGKPG